MGVIITIFTFLFVALGAAFSNQLTHEFQAWTPWAVRFLIAKAVRLLPHVERQRLEEEWKSHASDIPGSIGKIIFAAGLLRAADTRRRQTMSFSERASCVAAARRKRVFDLTIVLIVLPAAFVYALVIAIAVLIDGGRPIFAMKARYGLGKKPFRLITFRTNDIPLRGSGSGAAGIGRVGRFLVRTDLEYLPALLNVIRGETRFIVSSTDAELEFLTQRPAGGYDGGMFIKITANGVVHHCWQEWVPRCPTVKFSVDVNGL